MDYKDIYNGFEAEGQNVNVRIGRARARGALSGPSKIYIFIFCREVNIFWKHFYIATNQKKVFRSEPYSKGTILFWRAVRIGRARARAARLWWRYAVNTQRIPKMFIDLEREWSYLKKMV